jgi:hypothetical protein
MRGGEALRVKPPLQFELSRVTRGTSWWCSSSESPNPSPACISSMSIESTMNDVTRSYNPRRDTRCSALATQHVVEHALLLPAIIGISFPDGKTWAGDPRNVMTFIMFR